MDFTEQEFEHLAELFRDRTIELGGFMESLKLPKNISTVKMMFEYDDGQTILVEATAKDRTQLKWWERILCRIGR